MGCGGSKVGSTAVKPARGENRRASMNGVDFVFEAALVSEADVLAEQAKWADAIKRISAVYKQGGDDYVKTAADAAGELYAYGHLNVLFKPTKATESKPFR